MNSENGARIRVLVADDHPLYRDALIEVIKRRPELEFVGEASDGRTALQAIRRLKPDVAALDLKMPGIDGARVLNAVIRDSLGTRVLFVAAANDGALVYDLLSQGAAGYVDKGAKSSEIGDAIAAVGHGNIFLTEDGEESVLEQIRLRASRASPELSPRELQILQLMADGLSAPATAANLGIEASTVRTHIEHVYGKLGVTERGAAVAEGMRRGLVE